MLYQCFQVSVEVYKGESTHGDAFSFQLSARKFDAQQAGYLHSLVKIGLQMGFEYASLRYIEVLTS